MMPKVSILISTYNSAKYISKCLESAINQTHSNIEIICVDDNSKDNTFKLLKKYQSKDKRIKIYKNLKNLGICKNRNLLISKSSGEYFTFLDSDDYLNIKAVEYFVKKSKNQHYDLAVIKSKVIFENFEKFKPLFFPTTNFNNKTTATGYVKANITVPWGVFINREYYDSLNVKFLEKNVRSFEDVGLMAYIFLHATKFLTISKIGYYYLRRKKSISNLASVNILEDLNKQVDYLLSLCSKADFFSKPEHVKAISAYLYMPAGLILFFKNTTDKKNKIIFNKFKAEFIYIVNQKYKIDIDFTSSWWKNVLYFVFRVFFYKQLKHFK